MVSPQGDDSANGSAEAPFRTIGRALTEARAGDGIRVRAGTYAEILFIGGAVQGGTPEAKITLFGEGQPKLVPGKGVGAVVQFERPHWVVQGFEIDVQNQPRYAVSFKGDTDGSTFASSEVHHGTLGAGITTFGGARNVVIENNRIHHFSRGNDDSHGVLVQTTSRDIVVRNNEIHSNSGDSVQCLGPETFNNEAPAEGLVIEGNHLYGNRENAVDLKTCRRIVVRNNLMHGFPSKPGMRGTALVAHYSVSDLLIEGNEIYEAGTGIALGGNHEGAVPQNVVIRHNRIHDLASAPDLPAAGMQIENSEGARVMHNTIARVDGYALSIGHGTGGPTSNLSVENNVLDSSAGLKLGEAWPGLVMRSNLYPEQASVKIGLADPVPLTTWQSTGMDVSSKQAPIDWSASPELPAAAIDQGSDVGLPFCGNAPDIGAIEHC